MDVAVDLVELFLRSNGYLTLSDLQVQAKNKRGDWESVTDVDILALRFPGRVFLADSHDPDTEAYLEVPGLPLFLEEETIDVIVGEVKQGEATLNPALTKHETLHTALHRLEWIYADVGLDQIVEDLRAHAVCRTPARGGGTVRTRLVAFGQAPEATLNVVPIGLILERVLDIFESRDAFLRSFRMTNPAGAMLKLLHRTGLRLSRGS